ncbi:hypothetical protein GIB67_040817 [Kingdonia uniflora]|uniref:Uncharacterized protein n=1 Tax=Kingdonia uniflora TaxID=39325 RepID=A0A7J7P5B9_9MAGN|nr:hypothetical protein GIB67_040817 [Kingdonia uniflora]
MDGNSCATDSDETKSDVGQSSNSSKPDLIVDPKSEIIGKVNQPARLKWNKNARQAYVSENSFITRIITPKDLKKLNDKLAERKKSPRCLGLHVYIKVMYTSKTPMDLEVSDTLNGDRVGAFSFASTSRCTSRSSTSRKPQRNLEDTPNTNYIYTTRLLLSIDHETIQTSIMEKWKTTAFADKKYRPGNSRRQRSEDARDGRQPTLHT